MISSMVRSLKSRQIGLVQTFHLISGTAATPADTGFDKAYVSSIDDLGTGSWKINFKAPGRQNVHIAGLVAVTAGAILNIEAVDKESVTIKAVSQNTGTAGTKVVQDITYTAKALGTAGNSVTIAYTGGAVAGAEVVTVSGNAISVQIQTAVSTATQVLAKINASAAALTLVSAAITGTAGTAQVIAAAAAITGGADVVMNADFYLSCVHSTQLNYSF